MSLAARRAFTLVEVAFALAILAVAVTAMLLLFPAGLRAQQAARFRVYATTKALEMVDTFANHDHLWWDVQQEAERPGQCTLASLLPLDIDRMMSSPALGLMPLPETIARRLDSEGDEIAHLLDEGGRLYFPAPSELAPGYDSRQPEAVVEDVPSETQSLLFAVVGYAQQNALPSHPCLAWPYYEWLPAPPQPWEYESWTLNHWPGEGEARDLLVSLNAFTWTKPVMDAPTWPATLFEYVGKADALLRATWPDSELSGLPDRPVPILPAALPAAPWAEHDPQVFPPPWKILALRWLAQGVVGQTSGRYDATAAGDGHSAAEIAAWAQALHESCLRWTMRYAASDPYDWGAPRPLNRAVAFDAPLIEYDFFASGPTSAALPTRTLEVGGAPVPEDPTFIHDLTWPVVAARSPTNFGQARGGYAFEPTRHVMGDLLTTIGKDRTYPAGTIPEVGDIPPNHAQIAAQLAAGDAAHGNLCAPFDPSERCRQIVAWAVDWRAYRDCESAPCGPYGPQFAAYDSRGKQVHAERDVVPVDFFSHWRDASRTSLGFDFDRYSPWEVAATRTPPYRAVWLGLYGADRNGNGRFDQGPLPPSARLRALSVCRFNAYDRRLFAALRN